MDLNEGHLMTVFKLEFLISATAWPGVPPENSFGEAVLVAAAERAGMPVVGVDDDEQSSAFAAIEAARAAHPPVDDRGIMDPSAHPIRAVAWIRSNSFADAD
jgi:hypothetical protein